MSITRRGAASSGLSIGIVAGAVAGATSAAVLVLALSPGGGATEQAPVALPAAELELETAVQALRRETRSLGARIADLEMRSTAATPARVAQAPAEDLAELRELAAALQSPNVPPPPQLQMAVERAIEVREAEEEAERDARRAQEREERVDRRVADLTETLDLDLNQSRAMRDVMFEFDTRREETFRTMREEGGGFDREAMRTAFTTLRTDYNNSVQAVLTPQQWETYQTEVDTGWRGAGFGGGGFGGRGRDGGGPRD